MRKPIIAANWKMYKTMSEARSFAEEVAAHVPNKDRVESVICAPALFLERLVEATQNSQLEIGAQTMHYMENGAFTGEISPKQLQDLGVKYVIIGHSERRQMYNETDDSVNMKAKAAFQFGLIPIVCVGETLEQRENNETVTIVESQVKKALCDLTEEQVKKMVIAYEPLWAIGTGKSSNPECANEVCLHIRQVLTECVSKEAADTVRIQYGGSVKPDNIKDYLAEPEIDGALVGGASLEPNSFLQLLEAVNYE